MTNLNMVFLYGVIMFVAGVIVYLVASKSSKK